MTTYAVLYHIDEKDINCVMSTLNGVGKLMYLKPLDDAPPIEAKPRYVNGKARKGIRGDELLLESLRTQGPLTLRQIQSIYRSHGFAESSASSYISTLRKANKVADQGNKLALVKSQETTT